MVGQWMTWGLGWRDVCVFWRDVSGMRVAGDGSLLGWLCDLRNKTVLIHVRSKWCCPMYPRVVGCVWCWGVGVVSRGDGMCWRWQEGLLVRGDVSVGFGLSRLPWGGGMRRVRDRGDAMRQGSWNQAFDPCASSRETPCCCNIDQTWRKSGTQTEKPRNYMAADSYSFQTHVQPHNLCMVSNPSFTHLLHPLHSPVSGSIKLWVDSGCLHTGPLRGCHQVFLIHTVLQTVRDAPWSRSNRPLLPHRTGDKHTTDSILLGTNWPISGICKYKMIWTNNKQSTLEILLFMEDLIFFVW